MNTEVTNKLEKFFSGFTPVSYERNERILREYDSPSGVYYLKSGVVRVYLISEEGNELTALMHGVNSILPLRWAMAGLPNIYNYQAMNDIEMWRAPKGAFLEFIRKNPDVLMEVSQQLIKDCSALVYRMQHIVFGNAYAKVAAVVLTAGKQFSVKKEDGKKDDDQVVVEVPLTHQQIADSAGITRETASLEMKKLKEQKIISYKGRKIIIYDIDALSRASFL